MNRVFAVFFMIVGGFIILAGIVGTILTIVEVTAGRDAGLLWLLPPLLIVGIVVLWGSVSYYRRAAPSVASDGAVDGQYHRFIPNEAWRSELLGRSYSTLYEPPVKGKNGKPSRLKIGVPASCHAAFAVATRTWFDRFSQRIGLARTVETGDSTFDEEVWIRSDAVEFVEAYVSDAGKRQGILDLRRLGFTEIALRDGEFQAIWIGFDPAANDAPELLNETATHLMILAENVPATSAADLVDRGWNVPYVILWLSLLALAPAFLFVFWYKPVFVSELIGAALPIVLPGYLLYLWIAGLALRGASTSHDRWRVLMFAGLFVFALGGVGAVAATNALLDTAEPKLHRSLLAGKRSSSSRNSTTYYVTCQSWRQGGDPVEFTVSRSEYDRARVGVSQIEATTAPGRLGVEWIVSRHLVLQPQKQ